MGSLSYKNNDNLANVLVLDNDNQTVQCLVGILAQRGIRAHVVDQSRHALNFVDRHSCTLAFIGLGQIINANGIDHDFLRMLRLNQPELPIAILASLQELRALSQLPHGHDDADLLLRTTTQLVQELTGAASCLCLIKPLNRQETEDLLSRCLPNRPVSHVAASQEGGEHLFRLVGSGPRMQQIVDLAERIAPTTVPVLVTGESGVGKELVSMLIHHRSRRAMAPFVKVNCAALSDTLLESELFGHEKGAFTGALSQRKGRFEQAHGGTLLLDEITETPIRFQAKLLRIIEQQEFERVGGNQNVRVNVRIISTTNRDLQEEVRQGRFRADLYYRLSSTRLVVPALRDRREDLTDLVWFFVNQYAHESQRFIAELDPYMMEMFAHHNWPGNVRQLRNVVRTSLILGSGSTLSLADVSWLFDGVSVVPTSTTAREAQPDSLSSMPPIPIESVPAREEATQGPSSNGRLESLGGLPLEEVEKRAILDTLKQTDGNRKKAAEVLGISDRTLRERIRRYKEQLCLQAS